MHIVSPLVIFGNLWYNYKHYMIGEIWDNLMRHKLRLGLLLLAMALGGIIGARLMSLHRPVISQAQEIGVGPMPTYDNSLTIRVLGKSGKPAYELVFASDFRSAKVTVTTESLDSDSAVKVLNPSGQVVVSEQTSAQSGEIKFADAPKSYSVSFGKSYIIETQGTNVQVFSNLNRSLATAFMPSGTSERYVIMTDGLRKATWSDEEGKTALYNLLKTYLVGQIESYKSRLSDEVLNNKNADVAAKNRIVSAYRTLKGADQEPYREFIQRLRRGGVPEITYSGRREYTVGEDVDFTQLVSARDGEDGDYAITEITVESNVNLHQAGQYSLAYIVSDSDCNKVTLRIPITVAEADKPITAEPKPDVTVPTQSAVDSTVPTIGGGRNTENNATIPVSDETVWGEQSSIDDLLSSEITNQNKDSTSPSVEIETTTADSDKPKQSGISASQIVLIVLGIVLLFGLVRFIFDHYVR